MGRVTEVVLLRRLTDPQSGALWHPGETASFEDWMARALVERGVAKMPPLVEGPPAHKMVARAPAKKDRRGQ